MACTASKTPLFRSVAARGFATQLSPKVATAKHSEVQFTTLPNKLVVASVDGNNLISRVSVVFRAGSRNETYDIQGTNHVLRAGAHLTNKRSTGFGVTKNTEEAGGELNCVAGRETIAYNVEVNRADLDTGLKFLQDASTQQCFKSWEIEATTKRIQLDWSAVTPEERAVDLLHRAAFRDTLGNSPNCAKRQIGKISPECLQHFVATNFVSNRAAVVGVGIDHQLLVGYAKNLYLEAGSDSVAPSKYHGLGDLRVDKASNLASVAVATQGAALSNEKEAIAFAVLQQVAGVGSTSKAGSLSGALGKKCASVLANTDLSFNSLNLSYTDNGLFGFTLTADSRQIGKAIDAAVKALKSGSVSSNDVARAKEQLKIQTLECLGTTASLVAGLGHQAALTGTALSVADVIAAIDAVSVNDVNAAAKKVSTGKWSLGAVGNLANVPHVTELN